jgi:hypothetical protein
MSSVSNCDRCGQPAVYHETCLEQGEPRERHYCRQHGSGVWFAACRDSLTNAVAALPANGLPAGTSAAELQARLSAANTLAEAQAVLRGERPRS